MPGPALVALDAVDDVDGWRRAGFSVDDGGTCRIGAVELRITAPEGGRKPGLKGWVLDGGPDGGTIEGVPTRIGPPAAGGGVDPHPNGSRRIDHVVLMTPDVGRSVAALGEHGFEARRTREAEAYGAPMKQVFFRMGEVVLELVGPPEPMGDGRARFFGIAVTVEDLDATAAALGEHLGRVKDAVQPGRRIATLRPSAGVGTAVAFMSAGPQEYGDVPTQP